VARTLVLAGYAAPLDRLGHALEFRRDPSLAQPLRSPLGRCLAPRLQPDGDPPRRGPVHPPPTPQSVRLRRPRREGTGVTQERGIKQSQEIARALARALRLPLDHRLLRRPRAGAPAATLPARERRLALAGAFAAPRPAPGRTVIVVDDVMTTGATLRDAAAALAGAGAAHVINCVVARTAPAQARPDAQRRPGEP